MPIYIFDKLLDKAAKAGVGPANTRAAINWYRTQAATITTASAQRMINSERSRLTSHPMIGRMYLFHYDPKLKKVLPYYDRFPLVFPIGGGNKVSGIADGDGSFLGLNLHYLPPRLRARLMDALYTVASDEKADEPTKLRVSYRLLKSISRFKLFEPCLKKYLITHLRSKFFYVEPGEWNMALMLPVQKFVKATTAQVWADSTNKIGHK